MSENTKRLPVWPFLITLFLLLVLYLIQPLCRYIYTKDFVKRYDRQAAELFEDNLATAGITNFDKPLFFIGSSETHTNASCLDLSEGKYDIFSIFAVADTKGLDTLESSQYITGQLNAMGYSYTIPTAEDWALCKAEITENTPLWKAFPWYDSVIETEHCIIVQLTYVEPEE